MTATGMTVLDLLDALVRIDSVNPGLDPGGAGEAQIAAFVAKWGRSVGLRVEEVEGTPGRPSVILRGGRDAGGRRLLLCGHLDTVSLTGARDALTPRVADDRLYARGAYDMKAGLAAALTACRDAVRAGIDGEVIVAAVADEEHASLGIQEVLARFDPADIDAAVVTEPTERKVGTSHRGFVWTEVTVTGVAAHGSRPHLGADAILRAGHYLVAFDALDQELRGRGHPFLGSGNLRISDSRRHGGVNHSGPLRVHRRAPNASRGDPGAGRGRRCRPPRTLPTCRPTSHHHRAHRAVPRPHGDAPRCGDRPGAVRGCRAGHDGGPDVVLGRLGVPGRGGHPHRALRTGR